MNQVYAKKEFNIYRVSHGYIIHNTTKEFQNGHTHLNSFKCAKYIIDLAIHKNIPYHLDRYRLISLNRITDDKVYQQKISELLQNKRKKECYYNISHKYS